MKDVECASIKHHGAIEYIIINATVRKNWWDHANVFIYFRVVLNADDFP
jgi:hypothetical protein